MPSKLKMFPMSKQPEKIPKNDSSRDQIYPTRNQTVSIDDFIESNIIQEKDLDLAED